MKKRGTITLIALAAIFVMTFFGAVKIATAADTIKIGVLAPFHMVAGEGIIHASKMAAEEINAAGGVKGKTIELIIRDTEANASKAIAALKKLVFEDKVVAALGIYTSGSTAAIQPYLSQYKLPFIGTASASPELTQKVAEEYEKYKYYFRLMYHAHRENAGILDLSRDIFKNELGMKKVAVISEQAKWAEDFLPYMKTNLEKMGMQVVYSTYFDIKTKDYTPIFAQIKASGAEFIIDNLAIAPGEIMTKGWYEAKAPPLGGVNVSAMRDDYWKNTEGKCISEVTYIIGGYDVPISPKSKPYHKRYKEKWGLTPQYTAWYTYDAVYVLADALARTKSLQGDDLVKAIESVKYVGACGLIEWDKAHDPLIGPGRPGILFLQWQEGGKMEIIWPPNLATAKYMFPPWIKK